MAVITVRHNQALRTTHTQHAFEFALAAHHRHMHTDRTDITECQHDEWHMVPVGQGDNEAVATANTALIQGNRESEHSLLQGKISDRPKTVIDDSGFVGKAAHC